MTNGEKIKEIFPQAEIIPQYVDMMLIGYDVGIDGESFFSDEWWNAEYKEPTTKNDLGVDCISRQETLDWLYQLRSEIYVYMPKEWLIPMNNALDVAIRALEHPEKNVLAVVPCGDAISRVEVLKLMQDNWHTHNGDWIEGLEVPLLYLAEDYEGGVLDCKKIIQQKINALKEK